MVLLDHNDRWRRHVWISGGISTQRGGSTATTGGIGNPVVSIGTLILISI